MAVSYNKVLLMKVLNEWYGINEDTIINLENATLWRSNWDEESKVTLTRTLRGSEWDSLWDF